MDPLLSEREKLQEKFAPGDGAFHFEDTPFTRPANDTIVKKDEMFWKSETYVKVQSYFRASRTNSIGIWSIVTDFFHNPTYHRDLEPQRSSKR